MEIKICGLTRIEEACYLNETGVDYAGFVFYEKSKRNIKKDRAVEIMSELDKGIKRVAVTVSPDMALIGMIENIGFDIIQVHGDINDGCLEKCSIPVWRALNVTDINDLYQKYRFFEQNHPVIYKKTIGIVIDAPAYGSGKTFEWNEKKKLPCRLEKQMILAGGLDACNVKEGIRLFEPDIVDVSSSVEGKEGKSYEKIREFVNAVKTI
ncbi:MAG: phosphoribosylanthranilate isomerase [Lachnospiraceae bacterium]|nr:phosphoribosylanthranilate isomerase [Lachnospiraceae bacterium]